MTSPLPPRLRDTRSIVDRVRQDRMNLGQLGVGFMGGRFPPLQRLGAAALLGDLEDDQSPDTDTDRILFWNTDQVTATGAGNLTLSLTHEPIDGSLHVRWNGLDLSPAEWTLAGKTVTILDPDFLFVDEDVFTSAYAYYDGESDSGLLSPEILNYSVPVVDSVLGTATWPLPEDPVVGSLMVAIVLVTQEHDDIVDNGFTPVGESDLTTGAEPYRLAVLCKVYDGSPDTPGLPFGVGDPRPVGVMLQLDGGASVDGVFATAPASATSASTPAGPSTFRVWCALSSNESDLPTPDGGEVVYSVAGVSTIDSVDIVITRDSSAGTVAATIPAPLDDYGWCLATLAVR